MAVVPKPIKLVVGLGNPGDEYANTRHNAGFRTVDELARRCGATYWKTQCGALVTSARIAGEQIILAKPQSFMNCSGGPVSKLLDEYHTDITELLVIHDELDIPEGDVRVKVAGGHGGHNGLRSIIDKCCSRDFNRLRFGIGRPPGKMDVATFVLRQLKGEQASSFDVTVQEAADAVELIIQHGVVYGRDHINAK